MKTILAYGDSLTYGTDARSNGRHPFEARWPSALEAGLDEKARVIAEGLPGRTTAFDDYCAGPDRNGARILPTLLGSHSPLDLVIVMLGTNDLKPSIHGSALVAASGMRRLLQIVRGHYVQPGDVMPQMLIVAPPHVGSTENAEMGPLFGAGGAIAQSKMLAAYYRMRADEYGVAFFDAATTAMPDSIDGVHLDAANTRAIGAGLVAVVKSLLGL